MAEMQLGPGYAVDVAQSHYGDPTMESAFANLVGFRGASALVCVPYLFFPGMILKRNVLGGVAAAREKYPAIPIHVSPAVGSRPKGAFGCGGPHPRGLERLKGRRLLVPRAR